MEEINQTSQKELLSCQLCKQRFNSANHQPIRLFCCGQSACQECVQRDMIKDENKNLFVKGKFDCSFCHADHCAPNSQITIDMPLQVDLYIQSTIQSRSKQPQIICNNHPQKAIKKYCPTHKSLICNRCSYEKHTDHIQNIKNVDIETVQRYLESSVVKLCSISDYIQKLIEEITIIMSGDKIMKASEFVTFIHKIQDLSSFFSFEEESKTQVDLDWIWKENLKQVSKILIPPPLVNIPIPPVSPKLGIDSKLIDSVKHFDFIKNQCFNGRELSFAKIFRGSEDGFTASEFHEMVDNKDHILYLIQTEQHNRTFGGYFSVKLQSKNDEEYIEDTNAFIIQLDDQKIFKVRVPQYANYYDSGWILAIGGDDIYISDNCNQNNNSHTWFPGSYYGPDGATDRTDETESYLGGSQYFTVKEIEVFQLTFT